MDAQRQTVRESRSYVDLVIWILAILVCAAIPLAILARGYTPPDDVRRHVAKAISGKPWESILVLRPGVTMDEHPGWHAILRGAHLFGKLDGDALVALSIGVLFFGFLLCGLFFVNHPETWLAGILLAVVLDQTVAFRLSLGRPFILWMIMLIVVFGLWNADRNSLGRQARIIRIGAASICFALLTWAHGSFYLFAVPIAAFVLCGRWRDGIEIAIALSAGVIGGALLTLQPVTFVSEHVKLVGLALGNPVSGGAKVPEFRSHYGSWKALLIVAALVGFRVWRGQPIRQIIKDPLLVMIGLCALLGTRVGRFWLDWGTPAFTLYVAKVFDELLTQRPATRAAVIRLGASVCVVALLFAAITYDYNQRWSTRKYASPLPNPGTETFSPDFFPREGGVVYAADMGAFYELFYRYPHAPWRYICGYEPGLMPQEDLVIYADLIKRGYSRETLLPWIRKMNEADRFVVHCEGMPPISDLEWQPFYDRFWFGRLPSGKPILEKAAADDTTTRTL